MTSSGCCLQNAQTAWQPATRISAWCRLLRSPQRPGFVSCPVAPSLPNSVSALCCSSDAPTSHSTALQSIAADTASRTTLAYTRIMFHKWGNAGVPYMPMAADLDAMLDHADAAILIGDPALMALEERANRFERTGEELVYHDLAEEWRKLTGLPFVSAVWAAAPGTTAWGGPLDERTYDDFIRSRDHGLANIDALVAQWSRQMPLSEGTIRSYLTTNIHYVLDEECIEGMRGFFRMAAETGVLPAYEFNPPELAGK